MIIFERRERGTNSYDNYGAGKYEWKMARHKDA